MTDMLMSILQFFSDPSCRITIESLAEGFEKLDEPREVSEALRRYLGPILQTLPRSKSSKLCPVGTIRWKSNPGQADPQVAGVSFGCEQGWENGAEGAWRVFRLWPRRLDMARNSELCQSRLVWGDECVQTWELLSVHPRTLFDAEVKWISQLIASIYLLVS